MYQGIYTVIENTRLTHDVYQMVLGGDTSALTRPGQFINIKLEGFFLRRPISVCDWDEETITIIYKVVGSGTEKMAGFLPGVKLDILTGLGNGFDITVSGDAPLLIGGGVGIPPMYGLCRRLLSEGKKPSVILGFNTSRDMFYISEFEKLGVKTTVTTVDGSTGIKGFVTDAIGAVEHSYIYTCGPTAMLRAIDKVAKVPGQLSLEERMGCGFGACMGCSCETKYGNKRICRDGPVLTREEIIW